MATGIASATGQQPTRHQWVVHKAYKAGCTAPCVNVARARAVAVVLILAITAGWGAYAGLHLRHWLADEHTEQSPEAPVLESSLVATHPFEATMGPVARSALTGVTVGQAIEFDLPAEPGVRRVVSLVEWQATEEAADELLVRVAWRAGESWSPALDFNGTSPLYIDHDLPAEPLEVRLTILPADGFVTQQTVSGWLALHREAKPTQL